MSATNGYLGQIQYNSVWNGQSDWDMTSYPTDINSLAKAQVFQGAMAVKGITREGSPSELYCMDGIVVSASEYGSPVYSLFNLKAYISTHGNSRDTKVLSR
jgi:hypothetical protein